MADGSRDAQIDPKRMNDLTFNAPDNGVDHTKKCSGDTVGGEKVKLSFYVELDESGTLCEKSDERSVVAAAARESAGSAASNADSGEDRKKRCFDRYDSSESSDSGVAVLSPLESSGCSSSDITEPGSPRSPDSGVPDDSASARMPPWAAELAPQRRAPPRRRPPPPHRRITEYFNHKMKPTTLKRDATLLNHDSKKKCFPKNGVTDELEKYISYLSQTLSPHVLRDIRKTEVEKQNHTFSKGIGKHDLTKTMNGLIDYSRPHSTTQIVHPTANVQWTMDVPKQVPESSTKGKPLKFNGKFDAKKNALEKTDPSANETVTKKRKAEPAKRKMAIPPAKDLIGLRVAPLAKPDLHDMVSSTTKLDNNMNGVMCGSNNISLNPIAPKPAPAKRESPKKPAQPAKRTNRKSSGCIANSKNLTWSKANNLKQVQMKQNCANAVQASLEKRMPNDPNTAPKINIPNGVRQVPVAVNGSIGSMNVPATNFQNCHQINLQQQCNGTVTSTNLASFVAVPQNVMLTTLRIPQNGIPAQSLNQANNMSPFARQNVGVSSPTKLNGPFVFPLVQNFQNGAVVQIPNLMAKYPNFVLPQSTQITTQRQDHLQNQQAAQILINGTLLKLASTMNSAYANVNKTVPPTSQSIPSLNKNVPGIPNVGLTVQKQNFTVNLSHPMLVSQPGFIVTSVPNISVKETWSSTHTYTASSTQHTACSNPIGHHPPHVVPSFTSQPLRTSSIPIAPVKPPDNPIQGTEPPSSTVKEPESSETISPKCDIPWLSKTLNNINNVSFDMLLNTRPFAQVSNLTEKLPEYAPQKAAEVRMMIDSEPEKLRADKTSEEIRRLEEVARREDTLFTQITVLKDVSSNVQSSVIESNYCSATNESSESGIGSGTDKSIDSPSDSLASKEDEDSSLSLSISISSTDVQSSQKSPILKQPKILRFPPMSMVKKDTSKRTSSTDTTSSVTICQWENCKGEFESDTDLLEHLQVRKSILIFIRSYDKHDKCGLVWIPRVVAYRCRTCGISPCMSICRECFHRGDHATHDFNMFLSQAGGACDCGDNSVMKEDGFCSNHRNKDRPGTAPVELMCIAEAMMPRLILRLLQHFRENSFGSATNSDSYRIAVAECEGYVQMLMEFNKMGDLMRGAMTKALINPQMYRNLVEPPFPESEYGAYMAESKKMYEKAIESFPAPEPPMEYRHLPALAPRLVHNTLLDEFIFWTFKYEFPQNVVCFLLNMLPDQDYKEHLTRTFVMHYARIPLVLEQAADPDTLSNRVVHMSVQLFSNEALALRCVEQLHLLHVMVLSLRFMMDKILVQNTLHDKDTNFHQVIDCTRRVMKEHCYWPLVSDFNNVLSHKSVALLFLQDDSLVDMWFEFLSMLQGMNVNVRETSSHIEFEPSSYYAAFSCELEAAAYPMWSVLSHLTEPQHAPLAKRMMAAALNYLQEWLDAVHLTKTTLERTEQMHASFHFPLHRYLAAFLCAGVRCMGLRASEVLPPADLLAALALHPLRVQALFYEILAGVWVRNGLQIKGQAMTYIQANFCNSMVDIDVYWLQICAAHLPPDTFMDMAIDMFGVRDWLSMAPMQTSEQDSMLEGLLTFLAILVSSRTNLSNDELTQSRLEVSTLLAAGDKTHSQLLELMPERSGNAHTRNFETVLKELSVYRPPPRGSENLEQGLFVPRPCVWEQYYSPLHVLRRAVQRRDFHASCERYTAYVREKQKVREVNPGAGSAPPPLWPPLRHAPAPPPGAGDPRLLCTSGVLHGALLSVLNKGVHRARTANAPPDLVLAAACFLLETACDLQAERASEQQDPRSACVAVAVAGSAGARLHGRPILNAFASGDVCDNARAHVASVPRAPPPADPPRQVYPAHYHSDSDTEWEPGEVSTSAPLTVAPPAVSSALAVPQELHVARSHDTESDEQTDASGDATLMRALEDHPSNQLALALPSLLLPPQAALAAPDMTLALPEHAPPTPPTPPTPGTPPQLQYGDGADWLLTLRDPSPPTQHEIEMRSVDENSIPVNESIISLLLKLHAQLSGRNDSFSLEEEPPEEPAGDGPYYIGRLLHKLASLDARCAAAIRSTQAVLWPNQRERHKDQKARERREKEERTRRARERQQKVMEDFARRQQQFMSAMEQMEAGAMEWEGEERHDQCVICGATSPRDAQDPIGLVALLQSTSVVGHRWREGTGEPVLALSEAQKSVLAAQHDAAAAQHHYRMHDDLSQHFEQEEWLSSISVGWEGGVHAASCGHRLHLRCLQAYLRSLAAPQRPQNLHVDRGEFLCPVCRQLANSVLPLAPTQPRGPPRPLTSPPPDYATLAAEVMEMLEREPPPPPEQTRLSEAMGKAMEDMTATAGGKLKQRYGSSPAAIFTFVASLARTNLECELVQRGGSLLTNLYPRYKPRSDCIVPLMVVAGAHARVLVSAGAGLGAAGAWRALAPPAGTSPRAEGCPPAPVPAQPAARPVPLLLRDPLALLTQLVLLAPESPPYCDIQHFTCIVKTLYALNYYQIVSQFCAATGAEGRAALLGPPAHGEPAGLRQAARMLLGALAGSELFTEDGPPLGAQAHPTNISALEKHLQKLLLPYLRIAALLRNHLYGGELPEITSPRQEFVRLAYYLELVTDGMNWSEWSAYRALPPLQVAVPRGWARQLGAAANRGQLVVRRILRSLHVTWTQPSLLALPRDYDRLFSYYHERVCTQCGAVPKEASVCLLCGTLVCLKQACCRQRQVCEAVQHAMECGGGTGIFLVVTSTYIIVIRGRRACLWGSLYLDDYDEEDRDLKRGKPLYLSQDRLDLLQAQWLAHRFDHTKRTWVWHRDSL